MNFAQNKATACVHKGGTMQGSRVVTRREAHNGFTDGHQDKAARRAASKANAMLGKGEPRLDRSKKRKAWQCQ